VPDSAVTVLPIIESQRMSRHIQIVWHRDRYRSHASEAFVETAIAVGHRIGLPKVPVVTSKQGAATLLV
jgi:hypothetical protein